MKWYKMSVTDLYNISEEDLETTVDLLLKAAAQPKKDDFDQDYNSSFFVVNINNNACSYLSGINKFIEIESY